MADGPFRLYIDGFNLYFGLRDSGLMRYRWLDLVALGRSIADGRDLELVRYYTARLRRPADSQKRQNTYLEALEGKYPTRIDIRHGFMQYEPCDCDKCGNWHERRAEKQTDVNLAVDLVVDAYEGRFSTAMVMSGDSDLVSAVTQVASMGYEVIVAFPPARASTQLADVATDSFGVSKTKIKNALLPDVVSSKSGYPLRRPDHWS